jgi:hypothetical protein
MGIRLARELQDQVLQLIELVTGDPMKREVSPPWLMRPGRLELGEQWLVVSAIYRDLTGATLPDEMPVRERRSIDAVMIGSDKRQRIVEVDEVQHFTPPRAQTLALYQLDTETAFDRREWFERSAAVTRLRGGGFGRACPPLFPELGGRHLQRAFRDALADLLPQIHGWAPTLRIADFEVKGWIYAANASSRMADLLTSKGI